MAKIKKGDTVVVLAGKNRGKTGKVLKVIPEKGRAVVEGVNIIKKHARRRREDQQSGIIEMEGSINASNLAIFCKGCNKPTRIGFTTLADGNKTRLCKKCKEML